MFNLFRLNLHDCKIIAGNNGACHSTPVRDGIVSKGIEHAVQLCQKPFSSSKAIENLLGPGCVTGVQDARCSITQVEKPLTTKTSSTRTSTLKPQSNYSSNCPTRRNICLVHHITQSGFLPIQYCKSPPKTSTINVTRNFHTTRCTPATHRILYSHSVRKTSTQKQWQKKNVCYSHVGCFSRYKKKEKLCTLLNDINEACFACLKVMRVGTGKGEKKKILLVGGQGYVARPLAASSCRARRNTHKVRLATTRPPAVREARPETAPESVRVETRRARSR